MEEKSMNFSEFMTTKIIKDYYKKTEGKDVFIIKDLKMYKEDIIMNFYILKDGHETIISRSTLEDIFKDYLESHSLEYIDFKFIGTVRRVGYFTSEDTPIFQGVKLFYKNKSFVKKLTLE